MKLADRPRSFGSSSWSACLGAGLLFALLGCSGDDGSDGQDGQDPPPDPTPTELSQGDDPPGVVLTVVGLSGGSGSGGSFRVGDRVAVRYTVEKTNGDPWMLDEFSYGRIMISGPTFNYQRVIPEKTDVLTRSVENSDGSFTYTFADPLPAVYAAPYNDTASFGLADGELTGEALLNGTYTVGLYTAWAYTVEGVGERDSGNVVADFVLGTGPLEPREVVAQDNCNQCHESLRAHGDLRRDVSLCVLCHTAGSEDRNNPAVFGGTPGASVDFKVMIHKIHNGAHLPSVLGVTTDANGARDYSATPAPYVLVGHSAADFSHVKFPVWPSLSIAMPRDSGYTALSAPNRALEDNMRSGVVACDKCHGDPDGAGPLVGPAQGDLYKSQSARASCGSCHDDVVWGQSYTANTQTMGAQANDSNCLLCHAPSGDPLAVEDAHRHPLYDETFNAGLNLDITAVEEAGANNGDDTIDVGEKVAVTFTLTDDAGNAVAPSVSSTYSVVVSGPTYNSNLLLSGSIPSGALSGPQPYTVNVPQIQILEYVGDATGVLGDSFVSDFTPHWNMTGATTSVLVRTATGGGSTVLAEDCSAPQNFIDVASAAGFAKDDYIVLDDGLAGEEYLRIQWVDGTRLWFAAAGSTTYQPGVRAAHAAGATVQEVTLTSKAVTADYLLAATTGTVTEVTEFGAGNAVLVTYTSDFVMPSVYPLPLNSGESIDETWGEWTAKSIVDGTYSIGIWGARSLTLNLWGESNSYRGTSVTNAVDFLVGSATTVEPYAAIPDATSCYNCHSDMLFHGGGRRGFDSCILCHGTAGSEDRPQYVAPGAPATDGVTISFRTMLHKIHMGEELTNASSYIVNGFGSTAYPNNFTSYTYDEVLFPALPGGAANCTMCHGESSKYYDPDIRSHPTEQDLPAREWRATCGACHDSNAATAHIDVQTSTAGLESCAVCHGEGAEWSVQRMHKRY
jgi:OmcA/MtrC family decaheme c-type cytochrome